MGSGCTNVRETYDYNPRLQPARIQLGTASDHSQNSCLVYNYYDGQQPTSCAVPAPGTSNNGNVTGAWYQENMSTDLSHTASYDYDGVNRLTHATATGNAAYNLHFDYTADGSDGQYGNMSCVRDVGGDTIGACEPLTFSASTNRITTDDYSYDAAGNLLFDNTQTYTWDAEGQLRTVTRSGVTTTFTHFASGPIAQRSQAGEVIDFLYDPFGSPIAHYDATNSRWAERYIRLGGRIIAYYGYGCPPFTRFFHADGLGSMRQATDSAGNYVESALEYPWGQTWVNNGNAWDQNFAGMPDRAIDLDMYLTGSRQLGINLSRWLSPDWSAIPTPVPYADFSDPQSLNLYAYVRNNPLNRTDVSGHCDSSANATANTACQDTKTLHVNDAGLKFIQRQEGFREAAYFDSGLKLTVGYGHLVTGNDGIKELDKITTERAEAFLKADLASAETAVKNAVGTLQLSQGEFNALTDATYNVGPSVFTKDKSPNLMTAIEKGDYKAMSEQLRYTKDALGVSQPGLQTRSDERKDLFLGGTGSSNQTGTKSQ